jgi:3'(2'), 5'-bisphosphate nucleotidase
MSKLLNYPEALLNAVRRIAVDAGELVLDHFEESGFIGAMEKEDGSPVTKADQEAEALIVSALLELCPTVPVVGEETMQECTDDIASAEYFWLVDALDGTREFIKGGDEFTVNIALIRNGEPIMGVVYAPALGRLFSAHQELGAFRWFEDSNSQKDIRVRRVPKSGYTVMISKNRDYGARLEQFLDEYKVEKLVKKSSSLKICEIAAGKADLYPGFGATCEWDTAAGHAVLKAAGGDIRDWNEKSLTYGHQDRKFVNPDFLAASEFYSKDNE